MSPHHMFTSTLGWTQVLINVQELILNVFFRLEVVSKIPRPLQVGPINVYLVLNGPFSLEDPSLWFTTETWTPECPSAMYMYDTYCPVVKGPGPKKFLAGESNPGLLRDRQKCYQLHQPGKGTTGVEPVTAGSAIPCSTTELRTHFTD